ncbi:hypothetical protein BSL78_29579, partial [Apostichopus japonicus]
CQFSEYLNGQSCDGRTVTSCKNGGVPRDAVDECLCPPFFTGDDCSEEVNQPTGKARDFVLGTTGGFLPYAVVSTYQVVTQSAVATCSAMGISMVASVLQDGGEITVTNLVRKESGELTAHRTVRTTKTVTASLGHKIKTYADGSM